MNQRYIQSFSIMAMAVVMVMGSATIAQSTHPSTDDGFVSLFNGKDLTGWEGKPGLWSVEEGAIHGHTPKGHRGNTFLLWQGGKTKVKNFELRMKFKLDKGNSGIQYRSEHLGKWVVKGYQSEIRNDAPYPGYLYHEKGRGRISMIGEATVMDEKGKKQLVGKVNDLEQLLAKKYYKQGKWNDYQIIARGNHVIHMINGHVMTEMIDRDQKGRCMEGILALQIHGGKPMSVWFKEIKLKQYKEKFGETTHLFNGKDLTGWQVFPNNKKPTWTVKEGVLHDTGKPRGYIRTTKEYTSYVLRLQLRHLTKGNCGVLLRVVGEDKVWPRSIESQGQFGSLGDIWNIGNFPMKVDQSRTRGRHTRKMHKSNEKPITQWNQYEIWMNGSQLRIYVNGLLQNKGDECWITPGKIALQAEGSEVEFRNITLTPILNAK